MNELAKEDRIRVKRGRIGMASIVNKIRKNKLRWVGHVMRKEDSEIIRMVININVGRMTGRGRLKKRWLETIENDEEDQCIQG